MIFFYHCVFFERVSELADLLALVLASVQLLLLLPNFLVA